MGEGWKQEGPELANRPGCDEKVGAEGSFPDPLPPPHCLTLMMMLRESSLGRKMQTLRRSCMTLLLWKGSLFIVGQAWGSGWAVGTSPVGRGGHGPRGCHPCGQMQGSVIQDGLRWEETLKIIKFQPPCCEAQGLIPSSL